MDAFLKFDEVGSDIPQSKPSNMFGVKCFKTGRRPFILFHQEKIVCKLFDQDHADAIALQGATLFSPYNDERTIVNWVVIPIEHHEKWAEYAVLAHHYVIEDR